MSLVDRSRVVQACEGGSGEDRRPLEDAYAMQVRGMVTVDIGSVS